MCKMRWTATSFEIGQMRSAGENEYEPSAEPIDLDWIRWSLLPNDKQLEKSNAALLEMARPAFPPGISRANLDAILKRTNVMLNTKRYIYVRLAGLDQKVQRHINEGHYINEDAKEIVGMMQDSGNEYRREEALFDRLIEDEQSMFKSILDPVIERAKAGLGVAPQPSSEDASMLGAVEAAPAQGHVLVGDHSMVNAMRAKIKREQSTTFFRNLKPKVRGIKGCIDLTADDVEAAMQPAEPRPPAAKMMDLDPDDEEDVFGYGQESL